MRLNIQFKDNSNNESSFKIFRATNSNLSDKVEIFSLSYSNGWNLSGSQNLVLKSNNSEPSSTGEIFSIDFDENLTGSFYYGVSAYNSSGESSINAIISPFTLATTTTLAPTTSTTTTLAPTTSTTTTLAPTTSTTTTLAPTTTIAPKEYYSFAGHNTSPWLHTKSELDDMTIIDAPYMDDGDIVRVNNGFTSNQNGSSHQFVSGEYYVMEYHNGIQLKTQTEVGTFYINYQAKPYYFQVIQDHSEL
jgi:hypothetical protein